MKYFLIAFGCAFLYRLTVNVSALLWLKYYEMKYSQYLSGVGSQYAENEAAVAKLFIGAGLSDRTVPFVQPMGYGQILQGQTSLFNNMSNLREDVVANMKLCFSSARGSYKSRIIENFSPIFWINCVLFLPRTVLTYLGVSTDNFFSKLFQLIYWLSAPLLILFRDNLYELIRSLLK